MGLFNNIFGSTGTKKDEKILPWQPLTNKEQIEGISNSSHNKPQIIFKHSTRCGISRMVMNQFVATYNISDSEADLYYLDILNNREVSSEIGYFFQVRHESPQLLIIKDGNVVTHASHGGINEINFQKFI